ncbi:A/G-specific adenine glycosylase [Roseiconus nitratireducens]|uniref:Adenine DNA glycosylase n=1 Tax=Roseiconus nitratireducens TaxID=2605748 RepID=A0A5M6DC83_9BACT|nr:A/G-specific adenine glycosylase [Roseiconus nitratireducens]KAA5545171.1 A/G-specific adenine glycosylase [Roseiconus nitratireducens]
MRRKLLAWFDQNAREMPWRSDPQPYHVWVSEIMLQQTQVATVLPYYRRWMKSFPTVADLAAADEAELLRHWEGLGYYRRVRSLHAAAKQIMERHGGEFPLDFESVLALPGVGRYTAGAVLSISAGAKLPVLEGNTQRVYSRWIALRRPPSDPSATRLLWDVAQAMLPHRGASSGTFNQAAMELGALVCTPTGPDCDSCPVRAHCQAAKQELQTEIPGKIKRLRYEDRTEFALIVDRKRRRETEYLMRPLPEGGRWAGLWDFPRPTEVGTETVDQAASWLAEQLGVPVDHGPRLRTLRHAVTRYRISLHIHRARLSEATSMADPPPTPWQWVRLSHLDQLPMSTTGRQIHAYLQDNRQPLLPLG